MKTAETRIAYQKRADQFIARVAKEFDTNPNEVSWIEVARFAYSCQPSWKRATWFLMRAALLYQMELESSADAMQAAEYLRSRSAHACKKVSTSTSARRRKNFGDDDIDAIIKEIRSRRSQHGPLLELWIIFGRITGLRPHEWCQAEVIDRLPETGEQGSFLRIRNAKNTNGRGNGPYRHLDLSGLAPNIIEGLIAFSQQMRRLQERGEYESVYSGARALLLRVNRVLYGGRSARYISLYSIRHRFSSVAKASVSLMEVAALMGHNNNQTAASHYGKRRHGSGGLDIKPRESEVATVRDQRSAVSRPLNESQISAEGENKTRT